MPTLVSSAHSGSSTSLFPLLLIGFAVLLMALMMFSQRRRTAGARAAQASIEIGDEVRTTSGLLGTVRGLDDENFHLEIAKGVVVRFDRRAVLPLDHQNALGQGRGAQGASAVTSADDKH